MNDATRLTGLAALALAAGVALHLLTRDRSEPIQVAVEKTTAPERTQSRLADLAGETEVPQEYKQVDRYIQERFGHLDRQPEHLANLDATGTETIYMRKVIPAWTPNGINYLTGAAQAIEFDGLLITRKNSHLIAPAAKLEMKLDKPPRGLSERWTRRNPHITRAEDMPEEYRDFFPTDEKIAEWHRVEREARERALAEEAADLAAAKAALEAAQEAQEAQQGEGDEASSEAEPSDAEPSDAEPSDAEPSEAEPSDGAPSDAGPSDAEHAAEDVDPAGGEVSTEESGTGQDLEPTDDGADETGADPADGR